MKNLALFASGSGTNAENIISYFKNSANVRIKSIFSNNPEAYVIKRAANHNIESCVFSKEEFYNSEKVLNILKNQQIDLIVLAGFMWLVPEYLIDNYRNAIVNIHPALLPAYGGKGMYGDNVHKAVIANKEKESGITIHFVNKVYDDGKIIFQAKCSISENDSPEILAEKIHNLEYKHFPEIIEKVLFNNSL